MNSAKKLKRAIEELVSTEKKYNKKLQEAINSCTGLSKDSKGAKQVLFSNAVEKLHGIKKTSDKLLKLLEDDKERPLEALIKCALEALIKCASELKAYESYIPLYELIIDSEPTLNSLLMEPVQRVMRYKMLLEAMHKHTDAESPFYKNQKTAIAKMQKTAQYVNDRQTYWKNHLKNNAPLIFPQVAFQLSTLKTHAKTLNKIRLSTTFYFSSFLGRNYCAIKVKLGESIYTLSLSKSPDLQNTFSIQVEKCPSEVKPKLIEIAEEIGKAIQNTMKKSKFNLTELQGNGSWMKIVKKEDKEKALSPQKGFIVEDEQEEIKIREEETSSKKIKDLEKELNKMKAKLQKAEKDSDRFEFLACKRFEGLRQLEQPKHPNVLKKASKQLEEMLSPKKTVHNQALQKQRLQAQIKEQKGKNATQNKTKLEVLNKKLNLEKVVRQLNDNIQNLGRDYQLATERTRIQHEAALKGESDRADQAEGNVRNLNGRINGQAQQIQQLEADNQGLERRNHDLQGQVRLLNGNILNLGGEHQAALQRESDRADQAERNVQNLNGTINEQARQIQQLEAGNQGLRGQVQRFPQQQDAAVQQALQQQQQQNQQLRNQALERQARQNHVVQLRTGLTQAQRAMGQLLERHRGNNHEQQLAAVQGALDNLQPQQVANANLGNLDNVLQNTQTYVQQRQQAAAIQQALQQQEQQNQQLQNQALERQARQNHVVQLRTGLTQAQRAMGQLLPRHQGNNHVQQLAAVQGALDNLQPQQVANANLGNLDNVLQNAQTYVQQRQQAAAVQQALQQQAQRLQAAHQLVLQQRAQENQRLNNQNQIQGRRINNLVQARQQQNQVQERQRNALALVGQQVQDVQQELNVLREILSNPKKLRARLKQFRGKPLG